MVISAEVDADGDGDTDVTGSFEVNAKSGATTVSISGQEGPINIEVEIDGESITATVNGTWDF